MSSRARKVLAVIGIVCLVVGGVWIGQGANLIPGSSMTGSQLWLVIGCALAAVGLVLLVVAGRRRR